MGRITGRVGWAFTGLSVRLYRPEPPPAPAPTPQEQMVALWFERQGDKTLRVEYDLDEGSLVFDLGGYEGQWASDIFARYCCKIHVFEPIEEYAARIEKRFAKNGKIVVHRCGLGAETENLKIAVSRDGSSVFKSAERVADCALVRATDFMRDNAVSKIDLMKINIEGGEYDLLEHLVASGFVANIRDIQVQFHDFVPDAERRMSEIQRQLGRTHYLTYQYRFVWENWRLKGDS